MLVDDDGRVPGAADIERFRLDVAVAEMYADLRVDPLMQRLLRHSRDLLNTVAGSISLVDPGNGRYDKIAEDGITCQLGRAFPLDEGASGEAVTRRMPVIIDDYSAVRGGHLPRDHPASRGAAAAVPLWWRGEVIGVNVAFAGRARRFTPAEVDAFELLTQSVAAAVVEAGRRVPSLAGLLREHCRVAGDPAVQTVVTEVGVARPVRDDVAAAAADLVALVRRAAALRTSPSRLHVAVVHRPEGVRLLVQDEATEVVDPAGDPLGLGTRSWNELLAVTGGGLGGEIGVEHVAGWGTLLRADFPDIPDRDQSGHDPGRTPPAMPLTPREIQVLHLLADGLSDREVAGRLGISPKTVEKHVGAVLRKTGTTSRTAAVVHGLDRGWLGTDTGPDHAEQRAQDVSAHR
jgi:DNA-binding CsgD family transcriptional regulator